jgi:hypothetical protein
MIVVTYFLQLDRSRTIIPNVHSSMHDSRFDAPSCLGKDLQAIDDCPYLLQLAFYPLSPSVINLRSSLTVIWHPVAARTSSTDTPGAISTSVRPPLPNLSQSRTHRSVIMRSTTRLPVRGSEHSSRIFGLPSFAVWSIVTITREFGAQTRSMAPPIPCFE